MRILTLVAIGALVLLALGCRAQPSEPSTSTPSIAGLWTIPALKGQPVSLSEIAFESDGVFRQSGSNALGMPVAFQGRYQIEDSAGMWILRLTYNDYPDRPEVWYFRLEGNRLIVAKAPGGLDSGAVTVFERAQQQ